MIRQLLRRFLYGALVLAGVITLVFFLFQGLGDPARLTMGQSGDAATIRNIRKELYLDQPIWKQYLYYLRDLSPLSLHTAEEIKEKHLQGLFIGSHYKFAIKVPYLRRSYQGRREVWDILMEALPGTILLASAAMLFATVIGIGLGVLAALKQNTWVDSTAMFTSVLGISVPSFFMGILVAYFFAVYLGAVTGLHITGSYFEYDDITGQKYLAVRNLILPALTLGIRPLAIIAQITRASMLDVLNQDYIRTAYAKGLTKSRVVGKHALRNALNPVITAITGWFAELLAGAFFVEYIFGWKGIGKITVDALDKLDFPVVMGSVLVTATLFILVNILSDLMYRLVDPRIRLSE